MVYVVLSGIPSRRPPGSLRLVGSRKGGGLEPKDLLYHTVGPMDASFCPPSRVRQSRSCILDLIASKTPAHLQNNARTTSATAARDAPPRSSVTLSCTSLTSPGLTGECKTWSDGPPSSSGDMEPRACVNSWVSGQSPRVMEQMEGGGLQDPVDPVYSLAAHHTTQSSPPLMADYDAETMRTAAQRNRQASKKLFLHIHHSKKGSPEEIKSPEARRPLSKTPSQISAYTDSSSSSGGSALGSVSKSSNMYASLRQYNHSHSHSQRQSLRMVRSMSSENCGEEWNTPQQRRSILPLKDDLNVDESDDTNASHPGTVSSAAANRGVSRKISSRKKAARDRPSSTQIVVPSCDYDDRKSDDSGVALCTDSPTSSRSASCSALATIPSPSHSPSFTSGPVVYAVPTRNRVVSAMLTAEPSSAYFKSPPPPLPRKPPPPLEDMFTPLTTQNRLATSSPSVYENVPMSTPVPAPRRTAGKPTVQVHPWTQHTSPQRPPVPKKPSFLASGVPLENAETDCARLSALVMEGDDQLRGILGSQPLSSRVHMGEDNQLTLNINHNANVCNSSNISPDSSYHTTSAGKAKFLVGLHHRPSSHMANNNNNILDAVQLETKKNELVASLSRKLRILSSEQDMVDKEREANDELGEEVCHWLHEANAALHLIDKFNQHVTEVDNITQLMLKLAGQLARVDNAIINMTPNETTKDKPALVDRKNRLLSQLHDARSLEDSVYRRGNTVSQFLNDILSGEQLQDYTYFINMKKKLAVQAREIEDKIRLGHEQTHALQLSMQQLTPNS